MVLIMLELVQIYLVQEIIVRNDHLSVIRINSLSNTIYYPGLFSLIIKTHPSAFLTLLVQTFLYISRYFISGINY